jgi:hypothetical protein
MITLGLAWISAHYNENYFLLFLGTVLIDIAIADAIGKIFNHKGD